MGKKPTLTVDLAEILRPEANSFGVVRLAMALAVLVSHSYFFVSGRSSAEPLVSLTGHSLGEHAVQVFFFLSGILVTQSYFKSGSIIDFACARALRIFPGLAVCVLLTALLLVPLVSAIGPTAYFADPVLARYIAQTLLLTTGAAPLPGAFLDLPASGLVNMSLWTLKYEVTCYAALGLICATGVLTARHKFIGIAAVALLVAGVFLKQPMLAQDYTPLDNLRYFTLYFSTGVLAFLIKDWLVISAIPLLALTALFAVSIDTRFCELSCALTLGYATLYFANVDFGSLRRWTHEHDLSFGVYIYAAPIQQTILHLHPNLRPLELAVIATLCAFAVARFSWGWIEKPALAARRPLTLEIRAGLGWPKPESWRTGLSRIGY